VKEITQMPSQKKKRLVAEHSYFDEKSNKWMIGVQINLSIGWVHP